VTLATLAQMPDKDEEFERLTEQVKTLTSERDGALAMASSYMRERDAQRIVLAEQREEIARLKKEVESWEQSQ
jgi:hypothetical protein